MKIRLSVLPALILPWVAGCGEEEESGGGGTPGALEQGERITELEHEVEVLRWERSRLALKVRTVDGGEMTRDKLTGLWHHDVHREPFTGRAVQKFPDGTLEADASFMNGREDGTQRYWYPNGKVREEAQWLEGQRHGIHRLWSPQGKLVLMERHKRGRLAETLLDNRK